MAGKIAGIMARRVRAGIGRLAAAIDPVTAGKSGSERLVRPSQTVWWSQGEDDASGFVW
jgi:hypothetical protein